MTVKRLVRAAAAAAISGGGESKMGLGLSSTTPKRTLTNSLLSPTSIMPTTSVIHLQSHSLLASSSWSLFQRRGAKALGSEVRTGNIIQRKGRIYQVLKAQHTQHGRGGASIQVELRDVDSGNKVVERFRTDEAIERVYVEEKSLKYLYSEGDMVVLTDPETFEQMEVPKELFGKAAVYLKDDMTVTVQYFDERIMSASVPHRVACTVIEAQTPMKGLSVNPQYMNACLCLGMLVG